jgi:NAD+ kinase
MKIALYGTEVKEENILVYKRIFQIMDEKQIEIILPESIKNDLILNHGLEISNIEIFKNNSIDCENVDFLLTVGGDGTFLSAVPLTIEKMIPIAGINCGRLGFLADITVESLEDSLLQLLKGDFQIENRTMIELVSPPELFGNFNYAVNELTVHKLNNSSMIKIQTFINNEFLATYWADGLIIATPTGSTAYSLSVGGPIVTPNLSGLVITPIASHNLTVRPVVVPDEVEIKLMVEGRGNQFSVTNDQRSVPLDFLTPITIKKASKTISLIKLSGHTFYSTLRNKMMWGADKRN